MDKEFQIAIYVACIYVWFSKIFICRVEGGNNIIRITNFYFEELIRGMRFFHIWDNLIGNYCRHVGVGWEGLLHYDSSGIDFIS